MEKMERIINSVASTANEEMLNQNSTELVKQAREGNEVAVAILGKRLIAMAKQLTYQKNCYIYGQAEVCEAFQHALTYLINHFNVEAPKAKVSTVFRFYMTSTLMQMHQSSSCGKNAQISKSESIEDLAFAIPDTSTGSPEDSVLVSSLRHVIKNNTFEAVDPNASQEEKFWFDKRQKRRTWQMLKFLDASQQTNITDEELCIELKLVKLRDSRASEENTYKAVALYNKIVEKEGLKSINRDLLAGYGIIYDKKELTSIRAQLVEYLEFSDFIDVDAYKAYLNKSRSASIFEELKSKAIALEAKERQISKEEAREAVENGNIHINYSNLKEKVKSVLNRRYAALELGA